ncbi:MAG: NUDIX domain-containing protein [Pseudomonadota bacterium]
MQTVFFFGTLRDEALLSTVIGRALVPGELVAGHVVDRQAWQVRGEAYPMLRVAPGARTQGVLFTPASAGELETIAFYEEAEYGLTPVTVATAAGPVEAHFFDATDKLAPGDGPWSLADWQGPDGRGMDRLVAIEAARELMPLEAEVGVERINDVWPGIMARAHARARAQLAEPVLGTLRRRYDRTVDVAWQARDPAHVDYLSLERHDLSHRLNDGTMSPVMRRYSVSWGDAVTVLPYDPVADRVLMIEQFRVGAAARMDPCPWCIEVPAGHIDEGETGEAAARRETLEETGLTLGRLHALPGYYPTPGIVSEHLGAWIGEADLAGLSREGVHGQAGEGEDIRTLVLDVEEAFAALREGAVNTGPAQLLLLWLMAERPRLRAAWCA